MTGLEGPLPRVEEIQRRLQMLIPPELDPRNHVRREMGARVVFVMLYGMAVEGEDRWLRPTAVADMTDLQAANQDPEERKAWLDTVQSPARPDVAGWYSENTREPIRDETLRRLIDLGAVVKRAGLPTTSPRPRYALARDFARLFSVQLQKERLEAAIEDWRSAHLSAGELARVELRQRGAGSEDHPLVTLPSGERRRLAPGRSSLLTAAVVERFSPRFLEDPAVLMISESASKLDYEDERLGERIGFRIDVSSTLPDLVLVDLDVQDLLIVFVECVISDGAMTQQRRDQLEALAGGQGYENCAFVTAFEDRSEPIFRQMSSSLAWGTFAWFASEPDHMLHMRKGGAEMTRRLAAILESD